jgi:nicotinamide phosphoribosyltransferase
MLNNPIIELILANKVISTDSYKFSHWTQYPPNTTHVSSYIESRGLSSEVKDDWEDEVVFFGLQGFIKRYLMTPITMKMVDEAEEYCKAHGEPFNRAGFEIIVNEYDGFYPVEIEAVPEGTVMRSHNAQVQVVNTDERLFWVTSFLETSLLRAVWYPSTVATQSREIKKVIASYMDETAGHREGLDFKLHDFGARGVSSAESAMIGGSSHLVNFMGTDTGEANLWLRALYGEDMAAFSVPASEHSTMTSWGGPAGEVDACRNMLETFAGRFPIISVVSDSYDIYRCITDIWGGELYEDVKALEKVGSKLVVRPDSGDPTTVPVECIKLLMEKFGYTTNERGYKVLPPFVGVLQGDGINIRSIRQILENMKKEGLSAENIVFGMGGALLQKVDRDTLKYAMKASARKTDGEWHDVFKQPVTDKGKMSKKGRLVVVETLGVGARGHLTVRADAMLSTDKNLLRPVYRNGELLMDDSLTDIRKRASIR